MASYYDTCERWLDVAQGRIKNRNFRGGRIFADGDRIYSYGYHFELGRLIRDKAGDIVRVLLNGDTFSVTTAKHQRIVRDAVDRRFTGIGRDVPRVIIPYSVLEAAGIDNDSVTPIDVTKDRHERIEHCVTEQPPGSQWRTTPVYGTVALSLEELQAKVDTHNERRREAHERQVEYAAGDGVLAERARDYLANQPEPILWTVDDLPSYERQESRQVGTVTKLYKRNSTWDTIDVIEHDDGPTTYEWTTYKHWLGESLIQATINENRFTRCRMCKGAGRYEAHGPTLGEVHYPGDAVNRNFACAKCEGNRGRHWSKRRTAYFISGFDHNETRPSYFFCELPAGVTPTTLDEAYEALKPDTVKLAEAMGRDVFRQGDIFAIPVARLTKRELRKQGADFQKRGQLLGTNHEATEVAYLPNLTLARGVLWHSPQWRVPDHKRVRLADGWHIVVKNTVPLSA